MAKRAYGTGVNGWRGMRVSNATLLPLVRTLISNQRFPPLAKGVSPKSIIVVKSPLLTMVAVFVT